MDRNFLIAIISLVVSLLTWFGVTPSHVGGGIRRYGLSALKGVAASLVVASGVFIAYYSVFAREAIAVPVVFSRDIGGFWGVEFYPFGSRAVGHSLSSKVTGLLPLLFFTHRAPLDYYLPGRVRIHQVWQALEGLAFAASGLALVYDAFFFGARPVAMGVAFVLCLLLLFGGYSWAFRKRCPVTRSAAAKNTQGL